MAKVTLSIEDVGAQSVSIITEIEGVESDDDLASPAMMIAMATRAMFENGLLAEAAGVALAGMAEGKVPSECILHHFKKKVPE